MPARVQYNCPSLPAVAAAGLVHKGDARAPPDNLLPQLDNLLPHLGPLLQAVRVHHQLQRLPGALRNPVPANQHLRLTGQPDKWR